MPATHEIADLVHEFNKSENTIQCSGMSSTYARLCSYFAMAGIPFVTVPQDTERIIVVLADEKTWKPIFNLATSMDDDSAVRFILDELRNKAVMSAPAVLAAVSPAARAPAFDEVEPSDSDMFEVTLTGVPNFSNKIMVIKVVRELTGFGLKDSKDAVEAAMGASPYLPKPPVPTRIVTLSRRKAEEAAAKLVLAGATVRLDPEHVPF